MATKETNDFSGCVVWMLNGIGCGGSSDAAYTEFSAKPGE